MSDNTIKAILERLPSSPGIYLMKQESGDVIYVGKAKNLKKRVSSYFRKQKNMSTKVKHMVEEIRDIEYITTSNELEALVLETNYIKEHKPKYNILMRDDKNHLYIKVTTNEDYPRIYTVRKVQNDGAVYFGPKTSSTDVKKTLKLLRKLFPYRTCNLVIEDLEDNAVKISNKTIQYPCIYYHIKRCIGPCVKGCNPDYRQIIDNVMSFLKGNYKAVIQKLEEDMKRFALARNFEKAAVQRDLMLSIKNMMERQHVSLAKPGSDMDVIGYAYKFNKYFLYLMQIRDGRAVAHERFILEDKKDKEINTQVIETFLSNFYGKTTSYPKEILLPESIEHGASIEDYIRSEAHHKVTIQTPTRGDKKELVKLANTNADGFADQTQTKWMEEHARTKGATKDLAAALALEGELERIECYDISHLGGTNTVASMVVFQDGKPSKKDYRRFKIKSLPDGSIDDFASMREILERRLKKLKNLEEKKDDESFDSIPDLIIIDGGKGQLSSVMEVANKLDIDIPIVSLAKREEELFLPGESFPILLPRDSKELFLVQNIRDEAHRFAISFNRNLRSKAMVKSILDEIKGVGPAKKKALLKAFGDVKGIEKASLEEVSNVIGEKAAKHVKDIL